ncbi:MAG TPA: glycosyltransferase family 9 protein, partial [Candidatus Nanoarchaeia archaeon]|nr:glycosyltransferase family 9 protein [Candidatus Nanoarchaeia archaeon]
IHMGAGTRWPSKAWHNDNLKEFITKAKSGGYEIILFGGPDEIEKQAKVVKELEKSKTKVVQNNPNNTNREFAALVSLCDAMVCSDSFALHISLALKKPTVGLFFCTSPDEIEGYGLLEKLSSKELYNFFPERMNEYNEALVKSISADEVLNKIKKMLN